MDDLQFYALFNSVLVISGRCASDNESLLCAMEPHLRMKISYTSVLTYYHNKNTVERAVPFRLYIYFKKYLIDTTVPFYSGQMI